MESLQQIQPTPHRPPLANEEAAVVARRVPSAATPGAGIVRTTYGAMTQELPIAGLTVSEAYAQLREMMHMPESVIAVIDGRTASVHERIASGSTLEFVRRSGEKGALLS